MLLFLRTKSMTNKYYQVLLGIVAATFLASTASAANILVNPGFEDAPFGGAEEFGAGAGWSPFGLLTRVQQAGGGCDPISCAGAHGGTVAIRAVGVSGAFQDFGAAAGDSFAGSIWAINPQNADAMVGGQIGAVNIEWHGAGGLIDFAAGTTIDSSTLLDTWTLLTVAGTAPTGTAFARFVVITGDFAGPGGGAPRFDDASFSPVPIPAAAWLFGSALLGLVAVKRKRV